MPNKYCSAYVHTLIGSSVTMLIFSALVTTKFIYQMTSRCPRNKRYLFQQCSPQFPPAHFHWRIDLRLRQRTFQTASSSWAAEFVALVVSVWLGTYFGCDPNCRLITCKETRKHNPWILTCIVTNLHLRVRLLQAVDDLVLLLLPQLSVPLHPFESLKQFGYPVFHHRIIMACRIHRWQPRPAIRVSSVSSSLQLKSATLNTLNVYY